MFTFLSTNSFLNISLAHWLVIISAAISFSGAAVYIRYIRRGKSKPNLVTWGIWAFAPLIATGAALSANADIWATLRIFAAGFSPLWFFWQLFSSSVGFGSCRNSIVCGGLSLVALGVWIVADSPILAILLAAIADLFATLPTILKAWKHPETETLYTYLLEFSRQVLFFRQYRYGILKMPLFKFIFYLQTHHCFL